MPDISMCRNNLCPSAGKCYRYMAIPSDWQSYGSFYPKKGENGCDSFNSIDGRRIREIKCKFVKKEGESCTANNNCIYPNCNKQEKQHDKN